MSLEFHAVNQACPLCLQPLYNEKLPGNPDSTEFAKRHVHNKCQNVLQFAANFARYIQGKPPQADALFIPRNEKERKAVAIVVACVGATGVAFAALEHARKVVIVGICAAVALAALASGRKPPV